MPYQPKMNMGQWNQKEQPQNKPLFSGWLSFDLSAKFLQQLKNLPLVNLPLLKQLLLKFEKLMKDIKNIPPES